MSGFYRQKQNSRLRFSFLLSMYCEADVRLADLFLEWYNENKNEK